MGSDSKQFGVWVDDGKEVFVRIGSGLTKRDLIKNVPFEKGLSEDLRIESMVSFGRSVRCEGVRSLEASY
jgi:hypothetical protein